MARGGKRAGAGRKAGAPNKATAERQKAVEESGQTPLDYMLGIMRDENMTPESRFEAAKAAAPWRGSASTWTASALSQKLGIQARKAAQSIVKLARLLGLGSTLIQSRASSAAKSSNQRNSAPLICFAPTPANQHGGEPLVWTMKRGSVSPAEPHSQPTDTARPHVVAGRVLSVSDAGRAAKVYDLTVEGEHEFFAGGVLVHNCRYALGPMVRKRDQFQWYVGGEMHE